MIYEPFIHKFIMVFFFQCLCTSSSPCVSLATHFRSLDFIPLISMDPPTEIDYSEKNHFQASCTLLECWSWVTGSDRNWDMLQKPKSINEDKQKNYHDNGQFVIKTWVCLVVKYSLNITQLTSWFGTVWTVIGHEFIKIIPWNAIISARN